MKFVIHFMYKRPIQEINQVLITHKCKPLGSRKKSAIAAAS